MTTGSESGARGSRPFQPLPPLPLPRDEADLEVWLCISSRSSRIARNASTRPSACGCAEGAQLGRPTADTAQRWAMQSSKSPAQRRHEAHPRQDHSPPGVTDGCAEARSIQKTRTRLGADMGGSLLSFGPMHRSHGRPVVSTKQCSKQSKANIRHAHVCSGRHGLPCANRAAAQKGERAADAWKNGEPMWRRQSSTKPCEQGACLEEAALGRALGNDDGASGEARIEPKDPHSWVALEAESERGRARCEQPWESLHTAEPAHPRHHQAAQAIPGAEGGRRNACAPRVGEGGELKEGQRAGGWR